MALLPIPVKDSSGIHAVFSAQDLGNPLINNLIGYYPFTGDVADRSTAGNNGTAVGSPTLVADNNGNASSAYSFNGTSQYIALAQANDLPVYSETRPYSIAMWVKGDGSAQSDARVFAEGSTVSSNPLFTFSVVSSTKLRVLVRTQAAQFILDVWSQATVFDNNWHHIVWTDNAGSARLYIDGNLDNAFSYVPTTTLPMNRTTIGALVRSSVSNYFNGSITGVRLYRRILTTSDVAILSGGSPTLPVYWNQSPPAGTAPAPSGAPSGSIDTAPLATNELWDHFNGAVGTKPSTTHWLVDTIFQGGLQTHSANQVYLDGNGNCVLEAIMNPGPPVAYVTGRFTSRTKWNMTYPSWCAARIKFVGGAAGPGIASAVWQLAVDWPNPGAELDLMEQSSTSPFSYHATAHSTTTSSAYTGTHYPQIQFAKTNPDLDDTQFHTVWMLREALKITYGVDDFVMGSITPASYTGTTGTAAFANLQLPFFWNITLGVGGWLGNPTSATIFPQKFLIDWIWYKPL